VLRVKYYKPYGSSGNIPKVYWMYAVCMGCYGKMKGIGMELNNAWPIHINPICVFKYIRHQIEIKKQLKEYREELWGGKKDGHKTPRV
jgi:hypothetical protein